MFKTLKAGVIVLALTMGAAQAQVIERDEQSDIIYSQDDELDAEMGQARATLDIFFSELEKRGEILGDFGVKVGLPGDGGGEEHIWLLAPVRHDGMITGYIANEPYALEDKSIQQYSRVTVPESIVSDWYFVDGTKYRGHFTTRILIRDYPEAAYQQQMATMHADPLP